MAEGPLNSPVSRAHRMEVCVKGMVQGLGFRPFIYRLASSLGLNGTVCNTGGGVLIELEGSRSPVDEMVRRIPLEAPPGSRIVSLETTEKAPIGSRGFMVIESTQRGSDRTRLSPDIAMCEQCRLELKDPDNRRYRYPFTSCAQCGPRFSIALALPYDRLNTTMRGFPLCTQCQEEYSDPADRRFHAQPIACAECGPQLALWDRNGQVTALREQALQEAAAAVRRGEILAVKGLGGFQLIVDARNREAVARLRQRKTRPEKPFAVMFPTLVDLEAPCDVSELELELLRSREAPIVLVRRRRSADRAALRAEAGGEWRRDSPQHIPGGRADSTSPPAQIAWEVAPENPWLGVMTPYTPLHQLLMDALAFPVVATSGNRADEPICIDELEALKRLDGIADLWLVHDRPIARQVDDSVARIVNNRPLVLRHARGYAPTYYLPGCPSGRDVDQMVVAVGGHHKSAIAIAAGGELMLSQHIGDLGSLEADVAFTRVAEQLIAFQAPGTGQREYDRDGVTGKQAEVVVACDLHPEYRSSRLSGRFGGRIEPVQHHHAHLLACLADNDLARGDTGPVLGVTWDGAGLGVDGTAWGGEWLLLSGTSCLRVAHMRPFGLPGGDKAAREPRRAALGMLFGMWGDALFAREELAPMRAFSPREREVLSQVLLRAINTPLTSSVGRIFDAVASLLDLRQVAGFEGQAAMELEARVDARESAVYPFGVGLGAQPGQTGSGPADAAFQPLVVDWSPLIRGILADLEHQVHIGAIAARFHCTLAHIIGEVCQQVAARLPSPLGPWKVALSGGCFQNKVLTELAAGELAARGFQPLLHGRTPPNDGGLAVGQAMAVLQHSGQVR